MELFLKTSKNFLVEKLKTILKIECQERWAQWKECRRMEVTAPTAFTKPVDEHSGVARDADGLLGDLRVEKREATMMVEQSDGASCG